MVDLGITGTQVQFSPIGTPSFMAGTIAWAGPNGGAGQIGLYQEHLTPILMDVTGDLVPDFVGTQGVATFSFYTGRSHNVFVGSITTVNTSYIQGVTANGEMVVGSTGTITACSGVFRSMSGGFTSQSVVGLYPTFAMQTAVHFVISDCRLDPRYVLKMAGDIASAFADAYKPRLKGVVQGLLRTAARQKTVRSLRPRICSRRLKTRICDSTDDRWSARTAGITRSRLVEQ